jgi:hypothetical protein
MSRTVGKCVRVGFLLIKFILFLFNFLQTKRLPSPGWLFLTLAFNFKLSSVSLYKSLPYEKMTLM